MFIFLNNKFVNYVLAIVFCLVGKCAIAEGNVEAGKAKSAICAGCHGRNGKANVLNYPHLAGQNAAYLEKQMKAFRSGERKDPIMGAMAKQLSDADIANLAAYYESLKP